MEKKRKRGWDERLGWLEMEQSSAVASYYCHCQKVPVCSLHSSSSTVGGRENQWKEV
jgi:hypothetical protein